MKVVEHKIANVFKTLYGFLCFFFFVLRLHTVNFVNDNIVSHYLKDEHA